MDISTQEALETMGLSQEEGEGTGPQPAPRPRRKVNLVKNRSMSASRSSSISREDRKRKVSINEELDMPGNGKTLVLEDDTDIKELSSLIMEMNANFLTFQAEVKSDLSNIVSKVTIIETKINQVEAQVAVTVPPIGINDEVREIKEELHDVTKKIDLLTKHAESAPTKHQEKSYTTSGIRKLNLQPFLQKRKIAYFKALKNSEHNAIYQTWQTQEQKFTPARFLPKVVENELEEEYDARKKLKQAEYDCFMNILSMRAKRAQKEVEDTEAEVAQLIADADIPPEEKDAIKVEWVDAVLVEEEKSAKIWNKKKEGILGLPEREEKRKVTTTINDKLYSTYAEVTKKNTGDDNYNHYEEGRDAHSTHPSYARYDSSDHTRHNYGTSNHASENSWQVYRHNKRNRYNGNHQTQNRENQGAQRQQSKNFHGRNKIAPQRR